MDFGIKNNVKPPFSFGGTPSQPTTNQQIDNQQNFGQQNIAQPTNVQQPINQQPINQQPQYGGQGVGVSLRKGQKVSLSKMNASLDNILVGLGWDVAQAGVPHDLDVEVFMLGENDRVLGDDWFVFYNKLLSPDGSVKHSGDNKSGIGAGDDEVVTVQLSKVSPGVKKLVFVVTINEAIERGHNFGQISNAYIRIVDQNTSNELVRFNLTEYYANVISMVVGEVYIHNNEWKFNPVGDGTSDDLIGLCNRYGVRIS